MGHVEKQGGSSVLWWLLSHTTFPHLPRKHPSLNHSTTSFTRLQDRNRFQAHILHYPAFAIASDVFPLCLSIKQSRLLLLRSLTSRPAHYAAFTEILAYHLATTIRLLLLQRVAAIPAYFV